MTVESVAAAIARRGQPIVLRRETGTQRIHFDVKLTGVVRGYQPQELIGGILQGDREVRISKKEVAARGWPGPPKRNDKVLIAGIATNVEAVDTRYLKSDIAMHIIRVRG